MKKINLAILAVIVVAVVGLGIASFQKSEVHDHADFKVYINGEAYDFSREQFMTNDNHTLSNFAHLHDDEGNIFHKHAAGVTLGFFFKTLGITFNSTCFVADENQYCNDGEKTLKMYVNGVQNNKFEKYEFSDLDRILITYGNDDEETIKQQIESVTDESCIQSGKCPDRGHPGDESSCSKEGCIYEELEETP